MPIPKIIKPIPTPLPFQTPAEEIANSILHGLGVFLSVTGLTLLALKAGGSFGGNAAGVKSLTCYMIYSATMLSMFLASTLYHAIPHEGAKRVFQILDHSAVYLLIAGTYTPISLLGMGGAWGWTYFGTEWALAITGTVLYAVNLKLLRRFELWVYLLMGWAIIVGLPLLFRRVSRASFILLIAGGAAYTLGTFWYRRRHRRLSHVIWHIHVITGTVCHWLSLWFID